MNSRRFGTAVCAVLVLATAAGTALAQGNASAAAQQISRAGAQARHTHPAGQRLVVLSGVGLAQEWGKAVQVIRPGDVVVCPPGVKHWHGAGPTTAMTHLAVTGTVGSNAVTWMEKVSDEQYNAR